MNRNGMLCVLAAAFLILVGGCLLQGGKERTEQENQGAAGSTAVQETSCQKQLFAMDTYMTFTAYGENCEAAVDQAMDEVKKLDALLSTGSESSEISILNREGRAAVSEDTAALLAEAIRIYEETGGLFDFTVYPLMTLWGFPTEEYHVPTEEELSAVLPLVDGSKVTLSDGKVTLGDGQRIDLGGIAKGYASAKAMEAFQENGVESGMVSLGGNIQTLNQKPDGSRWRIAVRDPNGGQDEYLGILSVENQAVITSGGYERYFEEDGRTYIHILDPRTGFPAEGDLTSVTIVSEDGTLADGLSTALYLMGLEGAISWWRESGESFEMILVTDQGDIYVSDGIYEDFETEAEGAVFCVSKVASGNV